MHPLQESFAITHTHTRKVETCRSFALQNRRRRRRRSSSRRHRWMSARVTNSHSRIIQPHTQAYTQTDRQTDRQKHAHTHTAARAHTHTHKQTNMAGPFDVCVVLRRHCAGGRNGREHPAPGEFRLGSTRTQVCVGCLFLRTPSRAPYRTILSTTELRLGNSTFNA